jgi:hypothetical protein
MLHSRLTRFREQIIRNVQGNKNARVPESEINWLVLSTDDSINTSRMETTQTDDRLHPVEDGNLNTRIQSRRVCSIIIIINLERVILHPAVPVPWFYLELLSVIKLLLSKSGSQNGHKSQIIYKY